MGDRSGPIEWGTAHPLLQHDLYRYYGDRRLIEEEYQWTRAWLALLESRANDGTLSSGLGDHESIDSTSIAVSGTAFLYYNAVLAQRLAQTLGQTKDASRYRTLAERTQAAFNARFLNPPTVLPTPRGRTTRSVRQSASESAER